MSGPNLGNDETNNQHQQSGPPVRSKYKKIKLFGFLKDAAVRLKHKLKLCNQLEVVLVEFNVRVGGEVAILVKSNEPGTTLTIIGTTCFKRIFEILQSEVTVLLTVALEIQPLPEDNNSNLFRLPPLIVNDAPVALNQMTQAHLRAFIPLMLKYALQRGKPGWGRDEYKPVWWPADIPWKNIRVDPRTEEQKMERSWTHELRRIVSSCYIYHGRSDLIEIKETPNPQQQQIEDGATSIVYPVVNLNPSDFPIDAFNVPVMVVNSPLSIYCTLVTLTDDCLVIPDNFEEYLQNNAIDFEHTNTLS